MKDSKIIRALIFLFAFASVIAYIKLKFFVSETNGDLPEYLLAAKFFSGERGVELFPQRIIKPVEPIFTSLLNIFTSDYKLAFVVQVGIFYALLVPASFYFFKEFFRGKIYPAILGSMLFLAGYPMLRTGLSYYIETGAWFFYIVSLYLTLKFLKSPSWKWVWLNTVVLTIGFLYKEYSIVSLLIFNLAIIFASDVSRDLKIKYLVVVNGIFGVINVIWQVVIYKWLNFTFVDWFVRAKMTGPPIDRSWYIERSVFALLIGGWILVPASVLKLKELIKIEKLFLAFLIIVPMVSFFWGAVLSRLYYVFAPGLIILVVLGLTKLVPSRWLSLVSVLFLVALNFYFLAVGQLYVY